MVVFDAVHLRFDGAYQLVLLLMLTFQLFSGFVPQDEGVGSHPVMAMYSDYH